MVGEKRAGGVFVAAPFPWGHHLPTSTPCVPKAVPITKTREERWSQLCAGIAEVSGGGETSLEGTWHWIWDKTSGS